MGKPARHRPKSARESALSLVAKRSLSKAELKSRLARRGFDDAAIEDATLLVVSYKYVDDEALADAVVREAARTGRGPLWVRQSLLKRGVSEALVSRGEDAASQSAVDNARNAAARRFGDLNVLGNEARQKAFRFLCNRGFLVETALLIVGEDASMISDRM